MKHRKLGQSDLAVSPIGLGCWQFSEGKSITASFWPVLDELTTKEIVQASLEGGVNWFDTAEAYGWGKSEAGLVKSLKALGKEKGDVIIATKWFPILRTANSIYKTINKRLQYLDGFPIDLFQVHAPYGSLSSREKQLWAMKEIAKAGKVRHIGVSNYSAKQMQQAHKQLSRTPAPLISNQVKYNLLHRDIEQNGVLDTAKELGISIIAYSPLEQGLLSGKFHDNPDLIQSRPGPRKKLWRFSRKGLAESAPLIHELRMLADKYTVSMAQIALRWVIQFHGETIVAIPGATKARHAKENAAVMNFELTQEELDLLDEVSQPFIKT